MPRDTTHAANTPAAAAYRRATKRMRLRAVLLRWHRWLGLAALPFVLLLVVTGLLLAFSVELGLDKRTADSAWLKRWYGLGAGAPMVAFEVGDHWLIGQGRTIFLNEQVITGDAKPPVGVVDTGEMIVVATEDDVYVLTPDGAIIEKLSGLGPIDAFGAAPDGNAALRRGGQIYVADRDVTRWEEADVQPDWATPAAPSAALTAAIAARAQSPGPSWERVLLDLHSGRLLGRLGPALIDIASVLLGFLALSGLYNAIRRR